MQLLSVLATLTSFSVSCVACVIGRLKSRFRLKRTPECYRPSEKNVPKPHTPPIPGRDLI